MQDDAITPVQRAVLAVMLADANLARGRDSWGYYRPRTDELVRGLGSVVTGATLGLAESLAVMAHTRSATTGKVTIENAHPYDFGTVVGAHNGMVNNHGQLNAKHGRDFDVDSMHIFAHLAQGLALKEVSAWGAVEYYNRERARMFLACFGGNLAVYGLGSGPGKGVIWSSSDHALEGALTAARITDCAPYNTKDGQLYCIKDYELRCVGPFSIERNMDLTEHYRRGRYNYIQQQGSHCQVGAIIGQSYVPTSQARLPVIAPKVSGGTEAKIPWVVRLPNESRKQFRRRRREVIEKWEVAQTTDGGDALVVDDELIATVVQEAVTALKDRRIEDGVVIIGGGP